MVDRSNFRVLVVDDDADIRETLLDVLIEEGFTVAGAENGMAALSYLEQHATPSVIVLDLMMPVMGGPEFRERQLRDPRLREIPVIVLSAAGRASAIAAQLKASAFLAKPTNVDALIDAVIRCCSPENDVSHT